MPPPKASIWDHFLAGKKQNQSHVRAHCQGCIEKERPAEEVVELDDDGKPKLLSQSWVIEACQACKKDIGGVLGVSSSMVAHILGKSGSKPCPNASAEARKTANRTRDPKGKEKREREESGSDSDDDSGRKPVKWKLLTKVKTSLKQSQLKVFRGISIPFTKEQLKVVRKQFLRATISANLPFRWVEDPEIITLFLLFRATADDAMPNCQQLSGRLLDNANTGVTEHLKQLLRGEYAVLASDGWKDESRDSVNGVNVSVSGKTYLVDLIHATADKKVGPSMCIAFKGMIDKAEDIYGVKVVAFCCDNDGGSRRGRKDLVIDRSWLFGPPCCAHQARLIFYFQTAETAEQATDLIGWLLNHGKVRSIFNDTQAKISVPPGKVLAFLVANMTCWTTHFIAFDHLYDLKDPMHRAVISCRHDIIATQVGAEKNCQKKQKLKDDATDHCDLIDDGGFWRRLKTVVDDIEPICLGTNLNQTDGLRPDYPDQALLTFAGIFLYFQKHSKPSVAAGMAKRVEKCWNTLDQPMFVLALVLNPFEGVARFGEKAGISPFTLNTVLLQVYCCIQLRPPKIPRSIEEEEEYKKTKVVKEKEVSESFLSYLSSKGPFDNWEKNKKAFQSVHGNNPIAVWKVFLTTPSTYQVADLALLLLGMSVNQAGLERNFSDLKIKKTRLRNRLKLPRLEKMAKVGADIRASHKEAGFLEERGKRKNHDEAKAANLLAVPCYADLLEEETSSSDEEEAVSKTRSGLVRSRDGWQKEMAKWVQKEQKRSDRSDEGEDDNSDDNMLQDAMYGRQRSKWLPRSLDLLFGGRKESDVDEHLRRSNRRQAYSEEARLMELLANEAEDAEIIPDDGELEGSGDNFEG
ncbi:ribonuclease H-like domain-containing protein [Crassisporium funariophilum]|nr:ribonuclease H-like domain-containing protein [Crassisporium funariophilum]